MQADLICIDAHALNLVSAHEPIAAALHVNAANIKAVMIARQWRKREYSLLAANVDEVKSQDVESGERLLAQVSGPIAD